MMKLVHGKLSRGGFSLTAFFAAASVFGIASLVPLGWHAAWCIGKAAEDMQPIALLVAGLAFPPLGIVHGMSLLLGYGGWL